LDRHVGAELLEYLLNGEQPKFNTKRLQESTLLLHKDLQRQNDNNIQFETDVPLQTNIGTVVVPILAKFSGGKQFAIALSGPLTTDFPDDPKLTELRDSGGSIPVIVINELVVRGNLPAATRDVQAKMSGHI
jgi:hypothetical protein